MSSTEASSYPAGALPGTDALCSETNSVGWGSIYLVLCVFLFISFTTCAVLLTVWFRKSRAKRKTKNNPHPPFNSTEKFYVLSIVTSSFGMLMATDHQSAGARTPDALYSFFAGGAGSTVNAVLVVMVMNWITILTARGKDMSMLPWVRNLYYVGLAASALDVVITTIEGFTHPMEGAYNGTLNGSKHLFLAILEGAYCLIGMIYANSMKKKMSSGGGTATDAQKKSVARIVSYSRVISGCGSIGVAYRCMNFVFRIGRTMYPMPSCSTFGVIMGSLVELIVLLICVAVVIAQKPASSAKVGSNDMMKTSVAGSSGGSSGSSASEAP
ncbi:hypothetical protein TeGR_g10072 [Tetraparma gracilis]|uniref:Uncharacterized protein n=1 Tax=Tetraparma gracilis TaxID=2962635 RepID=A0ABQ6MYU7_9STRA|nr:hypothetical protein TeGR_g10072 [Tetraparma gracilis]